MRCHSYNLSCLKICFYSQPLSKSVPIHYMQLIALHWLTAGMFAPGEQQWQITKHYGLRFRTWNDQNCLSAVFENPRENEKGTKATDEAVIRAKPWPLLAPHGGFHAWIFCFYFGKSEFKYLGEKFMMLISANKKNITFFYIYFQEIVRVSDQKHSSIFHLLLCLFTFSLSCFIVYFLSLLSFY